MQTTFTPLVTAAMGVSLAAAAAEPVDDHIAAGNRALGNRLWEVAAGHFSEAFAMKGLPKETNVRLGLLLAQSWIRSGRSADALAMLGRPMLSKEPATPYWRAMALAAGGDSEEAARILTVYVREPDRPHHAEAVFSLSGILQNLARSEEAISVLDPLITNPPGRHTSAAGLRKTELLLALGRPAEATAALPDSSTLTHGERPAAAFTEARLLLAQGRLDDAATAFRTLVDRPAGQSLRAHHLAHIGLADALSRSGKSSEASSILIPFLTEHPDSPVLDEAFRVLISLIPENPESADPILEKVAAWIPDAAAPPTGIVGREDEGALGAWPAPAATGPLVPYALYAHAIGLSRIPTRAAESNLWLDRLRLEYPAHPLAGRATYLIASQLFAAGESDRATLLLDSLRGASDDEAGVKGEAAFLEARAAFARGDASLASRLYSTAARSLAGASRDAALFNSALVLISQPGTAPTGVPALPSHIAAEVDLRKALAIPEAGPRKASLENWIAANAGHPRIREARLAAARTALSAAPPDAAAARTQLAALRAEDPAKDQRKIALLELQLADVENNSPVVISSARALVASAPDSPEAIEASYLLARHLFLTGSYNDARLAIEKLAATEENPARAQAAWLLAARSAALVPTPQSRQEALILFDKAIKADAPLAALSRIEKARLLIDGGQLADAVAFLKPWFASLDPADPLHLTAGLLLAEAIYANGSDDGSSLADALAIFDQLLAKGKPDAASLIRIQYLRGRTLEQLPDPGDPSQKREKDAFLAYYSVLESTTPPAEWHYFELCGFRALALLEKEKRWPAAIACARRIASFRGPRSAEAAARASQLQLEHMIWED